MKPISKTILLGALLGTLVSLAPSCMQSHPKDHYTVGQPGNGAATPRTDDKRNTATKDHSQTHGRRDAGTKPGADQWAPGDRKLNN